MKLRLLVLMLGTISLQSDAQQKCEQLPGYDLCKLSDLNHVLTTKYSIFTNALTYGVDSEKLGEWNKISSSIGAYIGKNHPELNKEYLQLRSIADGLANTVKFVQNSINRSDKEKVLKAYLENRDLFKKSPEDTLSTLRKNVAPGTFSGHKETRELLVNYAIAIGKAIDLVKADARSMGFIK